MDLNDKKLKLTPKRIEALNSLGIHDLEGLVSYYPARYDQLNLKPFEKWQLKDHISFEGRVCSGVSTFRKGNLSISRFDVMTDQEDLIHATIFNRPWAKTLKLEQVITISGIYEGSSRVTVVNYNTKPLCDQEMVTPVYASRNGIRQSTIRDCIRHGLNVLPDHIDIVPIHYQRVYRLLKKKEALWKIHFPKNMEDVKQASRTLKYEEFLRFFTAVELMKNENGSEAYKRPKLFDHEKLRETIDALPFEMTEDQKKALNDILNDMESSHLMYRLVQGDVGCGKTAVAVMAMQACVLAGCQAALLAPTEILAEQHYDSVRELLKKTGTRIAVLHAGMNPSEAEEIRQKTADGKIDILIGTHAILEDTTSFRNLGLVIADEQQRFGVEQRRALREKGEKVDFLLMSATPIPRTLASTLYGDMEISTIETMPPGRKPVVTKLIQENSFRSVLEDINALLKQGHQLYVICAAVEKNEEFHARNAVDMQKSLAKLFAPGYKVGLLHGRMSSEEKENTMNAFQQNKIQVLVSTTVVEVGMNVVNATGMIVYDADRFGLSQLHQLRGRVQRGSQQGQCWLLTDSKDPDVLKRLNVLVHSSNGFEISYEDLRLRGPGDILGTAQSGAPDFVLGNMIEDTKVINQAKKDAAEIVHHEEEPDFQLILEDVRRRNEKNASFVD